MHEESRKQDIGNVTRTINIPMLGMMLLHPQVRERFTFKHDGDESLAGRYVERICTGRRPGRRSSRRRAARLSR